MNTWRLASDWGILTSGIDDDGSATFNAGHLNDILVLDEPGFAPVLVASETSGVWLINKSGGLAIPLSSTWVFPDLNSLSRGVYGTRHVYAGGTALYETDVTSGAPLFNWRQIPLVGVEGAGLDPGAIYDIAVMPEPRRIVLACQNGVFWADIPSPGGVYAFHDVPMLPKGAYSGIALGLQNTVVVAAWGSDLVNHFGLFYGGWSGSSLLFNRASVFGSIKEALMLRTSIDSCRDDRGVMYAVSGGIYTNFDGKGNDNDTIYRVLRSKDSGQSWNVTGARVIGETDPLFGNPKTNLPGNQQDYNNCIGASPTDPRRVVIGWRGGAFVSRDAGLNWIYLPADKPQLHSDLHAVVFDQFDPKQETLYIGSDGGLAITGDLGKSYSSDADRQLPNLQFTRLALSPRTSGLIAGTLQDNGDEFSTLYPNPNPWKLLDGGDGAAVVFTQDNRLMRDNNTLALDVGGTPVEYGNRIRDARWNDPKQRFEDQKYFPSAPLAWGVVPLDGTGDGLAAPVIERVDVPSWQSAENETIFAVGGSADQVYGLFRTVADGFHWVSLGSISAELDKNGQRVESITAIGSHDGEVIYVGTDKGRIFSLKAPTWASADVTPGGNKLPVWQFAQRDDTVVYARASDASTTAIYKQSATPWTKLAFPVGASGVYQTISLAEPWNSKSLYVATDNRVYRTEDDGGTWFDISNGLPETPHCKDLRFVTEESGASFLYLGTYGWSVYRVLLNNIDEVDEHIQLDGHMDLVDRVAVGHDLWAHPVFSNSFKIGLYHPIENLTITEDDGDEIRVVLTLHFQWFIDSSIRVDYGIDLIAKDEDEDDALNDHKSGSFKLNQGATQTTVEDLESDEFWPDRAHVEFTVTNT